MENLTKKNLIFYGLCNFGWSLAFYTVNNLLNYFYFPNIEKGESMFPIFIPTNRVIIGLTFLGLIIASGRIIDAITDPIIANLSDKTERKRGKRRFFMLISAFPAALFGCLAFFPPFFDTTINNGFYLMIVLLFYYISLTMYVVPCSALVGELGNSKVERLNLSTASSVGWAIGFAFGSMIYTIQSIFENSGQTSTKAFQLAIVVFSIISFSSMIIPAYFIKESNYKKATNISLMSSLKGVFNNKNLKLFLISELSYWFALTFIQTGISYYTVSLLELDKSFASVAMMIIFLVGFAFYVPINFFARRIGKKRTVLFGYILLAISFLSVIFLGKVSIEPQIQVIAVSLLAAVPIGIFGILPFAIIGDLAEEDGKVNGDYKIGIFYALRGIFMKGGTSLAGLLFPTILILGTGKINEFGIRMTGVLGFMFCIIGFAFMTQYKEKITR